MRCGDGGDAAAVCGDAVEELSTFVPDRTPTAAAASADSEAEAMSLLWTGVDPESGLPLPTNYGRMDVLALTGRALLAAGDVNTAVSVLQQLVQVTCPLWSSMPFLA